MKMVPIVSPLLEFRYGISRGFYSDLDVKKRKMEKVYFDQTRFALIESAKQLSGKLNTTIRSITSEDLSYDEAQWTARQTASHIYLVNQYMIKKIQDVIE